MDRQRYEYALSLVDSLDQISDELDGFLRHARLRASLHPQIATEVLTFAGEVRKLFEVSVDPVLCDWRDRVHRHEDWMCEQARRLAPGFFNRVMQLKNGGKP